jgi:tetratricopeptide (TPR) repeat protein
MGSCWATTVVAGLMTLSAASSLPSAAAGSPDQLAQATPEPDLELEVDTISEPERMRRKAQEHLDRGVLERRRGDLAAASADFAAAQDIFRRLEDAAGEARALLALGQLDVERQEYEYAVQSLDRARHLFRQLGDATGEADSLAALAEAERDIGESDLAARDFELAAELYAAAGNLERAEWALDQAASLPTME